MCSAHSSHSATFAVSLIDTPVPVSALIRPWRRTASTSSSRSSAGMPVPADVIVLVIGSSADAKLLDAGGPRLQCLVVRLPGLRE